MSTSLAFWDFSLSFYVKPKVAECCLQLQDQFAVNVNVLLWAIWLGRRQICLTDERLVTALELIQQWDANYVQVLRQLRRTMKREFAQDLERVAPPRDSIKRAELMAEKTEQQWLEALAKAWNMDSVPFVEGENVVHYLNFLNIPQVLIEQVKIILHEATDRP